MKLGSVLRLAVVALATGAMMAPGIAPAQAETYPPKVSVLYASPTISRGYAAVGVSGERLTTGMRVIASRGSRSTVGKVSVHSGGTTATAQVRVEKVLPKTAGRYAVNFVLQGKSVEGAISTTQTYTVGKAISIKSLSVVKKSYGLLITGKAAKKTPVKLSVKYGSKTFSTKVRAGASFSYKFRKSTRTFTLNAAGGFVVTAKVAANTKYFSASVTKTYYPV